MDDSWDMSGPRINVGCKGEGVMLMSYDGDDGGTDGGIGNACGGGGAGDDGKIDEFVHGKIEHGNGRACFTYLQYPVATLSF
ncbi:hypothetical protein Q3G72_025269 [Acer saccharum]|nr:hypothetical protein Q3G72_025269 [Acer saccharum]